MNGAIQTACIVTVFRIVRRFAFDRVVGFVIARTACNRIVRFMFFNQEFMSIATANKGYDRTEERFGSAVITFFCCSVYRISSKDTAVKLKRIARVKRERLVHLFVVEYPNGQAV